MGEEGMSCFFIMIGETQGKTSACFPEEKLNL